MTIQLPAMALSYDAYIASPAWRALRAMALLRDGNRCRCCDSAEQLQVHHRRYPPYGDWTLDCLDALTTLCADCHKVITCAQRRRRYADRVFPLIDRGRLSAVPANLEPIHVQEFDPDDYRKRAPVAAQRRTGRPSKPIRPGDKDDIRQAR